MASKRISQSSVDWAKLTSLVAPEQVDVFTSFRSKSGGYARKVASLPEEPPKIDWSYYKSKISNTALVEAFEKQYSNVNIPYPTAPDAVVSVDEQEKKFAVELEQFTKDSNARVNFYKETLDRMKAMPHVYEWTQDEFQYRYPEFGWRHLDKPTFFPHLPEYQHDEESLAYNRKYGYVSKPDCYHP